MNDALEAQLKEASKEARNLSYSPYSKFRVGAAVLYEDGSIIRGANIENCSFGAGVCAERSAIITAHMSGYATKKIEAVAVAADIAEVVSPCGICRQFIREFADPATPIYMYNCHDELVKMSLGELLPLSFGPDLLK